MCVHVPTHDTHVHTHTHTHTWACWCHGGCALLRRVSPALCLHLEITLPPPGAIKASSGGGCPGGRWPLGTGHSCLFIPGRACSRGQSPALGQRFRPAPAAGASETLLGWSHLSGRQGCGGPASAAPGGSGDWLKVMQLESTGPGLPTCHLRSPQPQSQLRPLESRPLSWPGGSPPSATVQPCPQHTLRQAWLRARVSRHQLS